MIINGQVVKIVGGDGGELPPIYEGTVPYTSTTGNGANVATYWKNWQVNKNHLLPAFVTAFADYPDGTYTGHFKVVKNQLWTQGPIPYIPLSVTFQFTISNGVLTMDDTSNFTAWSIANTPAQANNFGGKLAIIDIEKIA